MIVDAVAIVERKLRVGFTAHALARYQERCRPALSVSEAAVELVAMVESVGYVQGGMPHWARTYEAPAGALVLGEDVAFPLVFDRRCGHRMATTCLTRGMLSDDALLARRVRRGRQAEMRGRLRGGGRGGPGTGGAPAAYRRGAGTRKNKGAAWR